MVSRNTLVQWLDVALCPSEFSDATANGLQVEGKTTIEKVGFAVDSCRESFQESAKASCDMLIVHHGLIWGGWKSVTGYARDRLALLIRNDMNLYVSHLPLDAHPVFGHNREISSVLTLTVNGYFGKVGLICQSEKPTTLPQLLSAVRQSINPGAICMNPSDEPVRRIGISSGSFSLDLLEEAIRLDLDTVITGELSGQSMFIHPAKENGIRLLLCGHYETETLGLQALERKMKAEFGERLETVWVGKPTGW